VLTELDLSSLQHAGTLSLAPPPLAAVQLPKLRDASQLSFSVDNATLIDLPSLISVGVLHIDASVLTTLQMPAVTSIGGPVTIATPQLSTCQINAILAQANYTGPRTIQAAPCP
jgi:hypothetical protein